MGEFERIRRYFQHCLAHPGVVLGNGDDAALVRPADGNVLAVSTDLLVQGHHFFADVDPAALGHKALAVNLSDLAAMGAKPLGVTLALAMPGDTTEPWLKAFAHGLLTLATAHGCVLVGGDTTAGPLTVCLTVLGEVAPAQALRRSAAQVGDDIYVSGQLGDARLALEALQGHWDVPAAVLLATRERLERPQPRITLGLALAGVAHAAADVSDGLLADLGHVMQASGVQAEVDVDALLSGPACSDWVRQRPMAQALTCVLAGGDDYELVVTAPPSARAELQVAAARGGVSLTCIGRVVACGPQASQAVPDAPAARCHLVQANGQPFVLPLGVAWQGFDHFGGHSGVS